jgi:ribonuclease HI
VDDGPHAVTNNRMELRAVLEALDGLPPSKRHCAELAARALAAALANYAEGVKTASP